MKLSELIQENLRTEEAFYHVSSSSNDHKILTQGLIPQSGDRSSILGDWGVFLFKSYSSLEDALMNWLSEYFDEDEPLTIWEVRVPDRSKLKRSVAEFEMVYMDTIPPKYLKIMERI